MKLKMGLKELTIEVINVLIGIVVLAIIVIRAIVSKA